MRIDSWVAILALLTHPTFPSHGGDNMLGLSSYGGKTVKA